ncbi:MAG: hypothetical protein J6T94_05890 [Bacteroidaceae bacterium]|nr:hypothetical protein [Bacteroidaceae bacterium]
MYSATGARHEGRCQADFSEIVEIGSSEPELGDVNGDSEINVSDVTALVSSILGN